jgi:hypothetical protein
MGHVEARFGLFGDSVSVGARYMHGLCRTYHKSFWMHTMELLGDVGHVEAHFGLFGDGANLDARWVHKFAPNVLEAWKSFWMDRIDLLGDAGHVESRFGPFGYIVSVSARLVHGLLRMYHNLRDHFGRTQWNS